MAFVAEKSLPFTQSRIQGISRKGLLFKKNHETTKNLFGL